MPLDARTVKLDPREGGSEYVREGGLYITRGDYDRLKALLDRLRELGAPLGDQTTRQLRDEYEIRKRVPYSRRRLVVGPRGGVRHVRRGRRH